MKEQLRKYEKKKVMHDILEAGEKIQVRKNYLKKERWINV